MPPAKRTRRRRTASKLRSGRKRARLKKQPQQRPSPGRKNKDGRVAFETGKKISAVLFGVLAVFQMFIVRYMMNNAALTGVPIMVLAEIAAAPVFAAACVWLFSRDGVLSPVGKKVLAGSALFYLLFIAVYYDLEVNLILSGLSTLGQELANGLTPGYLGMAAKVVLLVLAVGFAVTAPKKPGEPSELKEVLQEAAEAMSLDKETMEKEVEQAVSAFEENIGAEELDGGEKQ